MLPFCITAVLILAADLITKYIVASGMELYSSIPVIPGVFDLTYIINDGAAWGILGGKQFLLSAFTVIVIAALIIYAVKKRASIPKLELYSLAMIVGGGTGNLIGRVFDGYVVDFINVKAISFLNIFNIADIGITVGCFLLIIALLISPQRKKDDAGEQQL